MKLETAKKYNAEYTKYLIETQGFNVTLVPNADIHLTVPDSGAGLECGDGRNGKPITKVFSPDSSVKERILVEKVRQFTGPAWWGGALGLAVMTEGADAVGLNYVASKLKEIDVVTGTHGKCGFYELVRANKLENILYSNLPDYELYARYDLSKGDIIRSYIRRHKGFHPTFEGEFHTETALRINPYLGTTTPANTDYFKADLWILNHFGVSPTRGIMLSLEVVRALAPHVNQVELIV